MASSSSSSHHHYTYINFFVFLLVISFNSDVQASSLPLQCNFPAIFNFGDSNSDTGGLSAAFGPVPPPNGETFFRAPAGRYSDGRLIIDFIAEKLGLPYLSAYLDAIGTNFSHGANFASAGSTIRRQNTTWFQSGKSPFSLDVQFWQFSQFKSRSQAAIDKGNCFITEQEASEKFKKIMGMYKDLFLKEEFFPKALYTFDIGQNDITAGYFLGMTTNEVKAYIPDVIDKFIMVIKSVYEHGARYFWIHNTGPLGCLPYAIVRVPDVASQKVDNAGCAAIFNEVSQLFNRKLKDSVVRLRKELPLATFTYVDVYSVKYKLISQARNFGFEHPLVACCGHGSNKYNYNHSIACGANMTKNGAEILLGKSCKDPSKQISWDGVHFTESANKWVFNQLSGGAFSDPPLPIQMACYHDS